MFLERVNNYLLVTMQEHLKKCPMVPIECVACLLETRRGDLEAHLKNDCPEEEVNCDFADQGCTKRVREGEKSRFEETHKYLLRFFFFIFHAHICLTKGGAQVFA